MADAAPVIDVQDLTKSFGSNVAVNRLSMQVQKGEIYGFIGLNGAGKTTTIRMLLGMISPSGGTCWLNGRKITGGMSDIWEKVGYLVEIPYSYPELSVWENLEIIRRLRYISDKSLVDSIINKLKLSHYRKRKAKNLSLGNAQRLGLAKALIHNPDILILDEPANGLDPAGIVEIREMLIDLALNDGVTIFISSHILGEVSKFATRLGIIHEGKLIQESEAAEIEQLRHRNLHVNTLNNKEAHTFLVKMRYDVKIIDEGLLEVTGSDAITRPEHVASLLVHEGLPPILLKIEEEDLESYFLRIIGIKGGAK